MVQRVEDVGESEGRPVMGRIGPPRGGDTQPERVQTSDGCLVTRELEKPVQETKQMTAVSAITAGAVPSGTMNWHDIGWDKVHRIVRRLQVRIVKATQEGYFCWETASCSARRLRCLSRVKGDFHARFLGGGEPVMAPCYPTARGNRGAICIWTLA